MLKRIVGALLIISLLFSSMAICVFASDDEGNSKNDTNNMAEDMFTSGANLDVSAKSAVLMDADTGTVLYAKDANTALPPASVTKIMTLLLVAEALANETIKIDEEITVSDRAASMGGSQIFIKEGECFTVEELLKSTVIASANDAAVALAEKISGSEAAFVNDMNKRAAELGMKNTHFENATGLDDTVTNHLTCAYDIALMSRELIKHDIILKYSNIWQDSIRNGEFILTNTNRLVRYYPGCTGLKTGSTDKAGFCISATARRDGMHLIAVIMGSPTRDERNSSARALLDYGFANYAMYNDPACELEDVPVTRGKLDKVKVRSDGFKLLVSKPDLKRVEKIYNIPESIPAPFSEGDKIGEVIYQLDGKELGRTSISVASGCEELTLIGVFVRLMMSILIGKAQ